MSLFRDKRKHVDYLSVTTDDTPPETKSQSHCCVMGGSLSCPGIIWAILSTLTMLASCIAFVVPYWLQGELPPIQPISDTANETIHHTYFGLWRRCNYYILVPDTLSDSPGQVSILDACGQYRGFLDIPSFWWQLSIVVVCMASIFNIFLGFYGIFACCVDNIMTRTLSQVFGVVQILSGVCIGLGCALFAIGLDNNPEVLQACGSHTGMFNTGTCTWMWGYWLAVATTVSSFLAAIFSCHAAKSKTRLHYDRVGL